MRVISKDRDRILILIQQKRHLKINEDYFTLMQSLQRVIKSIEIYCSTLNQ
jgi:hypothetical protein